VFALVGNLVPIIIACVTDESSHRWPFFAGAVVAALPPFGVTVVGRRHRIVFYLAAFSGIPALAAMQSYTGGPGSGYSLLLMMPMVWFGLQATQPELVAGLLTLAVCSFAPMLIFGAPAYPVSWGNAALLVIIGASVAGSLHFLTREMRRLNEKLRNEATIDDLTGLLNRRGWRDAAESLLTRAGQSGAAVGVITIDLNGFKALNDSMGHDMGDRVLTQTAERLRTTMRSADLTARLGGDEFVAMLPDASIDDLLLAVDRLSHATPAHGSFSAGVATWDRSEDLGQLLRRSDIALYEAKAKACLVAVAPGAVLHGP
jgi:diguanylate cyclase (GGDEF)-like protein